MTSGASKNISMCFIDAKEQTGLPELFKVDGYYEIGDGGAGIWQRQNDKIKKSEPGVRKTKSGPYKLVPDTNINPKALGAYGDARHDDTAIINEAFELGNCISFSRGTYLVKNLSLDHPCELIGAHGVKLKALDDVDNSTDNVLLRVKSDDVSIRNIEFEAAIADNIEPAGPWALVQVEDRDANFAPDLLADAVEVKFHRISKFQARDCRFKGGQRGLWLTAVDNATIENIDTQMTQTYGIAIMSGSRNLIINNIRILGTINGEGLKLGYWLSEIIAENILVTNFIIKDVGLKSVSPDVKEGLDMFTRGVRNFIVSNGIIENCSGGGVEVKIGKRQKELNLYQNGIFSDILILNRHMARGISFGWTGINEVEPGDLPNEMAGRISVNNVRVRYDIDCSLNDLVTTAAAFSIGAWGNLSFSNINIEGAAVGFLFSSTRLDLPARNIFIDNCRIMSSKNAVLVSSGTFENIEIANCHFISTQRNILVGQSIVKNSRFSNSSFKVDADANGTYSQFALDARRMLDCEFENCRFEGGDYALVCLPDGKEPHTEAQNNNFTRCTFKVDKEKGCANIRLGEGSNWQFTNCTQSGEEKVRTIISDEWRYVWN